MTWRYVVLVARAAPRAPAHPLSVDVRRGFDDQLDLRQIESETGLTVYENTAWSPVRLVLPILADTGVRSGTLSPTDLLRSQAAFLGPRHDRTFSATVNPDSALVFRSSFDSAWKFSIDGRRVSPIALDAGGMAFVPASPAGSTSPVRATVSYRDGRVHWLVVVMQVLLWISALAALIVAKANRQPNREALLLAQERLEAATAVDNEDDDRFGDPFRTSFAPDSDRGFGIDADFAHPPETDDAFAAFDTPVRTADRAPRRSARPSRAPRAAGRSGPSARRLTSTASTASTASTTERVEPAVPPSERVDLPEDGSLADELWERWMRRRGGDAPVDNDDV